jgi:hypothetical protein
MNPLSEPRQQQQKQQQKQKTLRIKKQENTLEFHSRLIEAAEVRFSTRAGRSHPLSPDAFGTNDQKSPSFIHTTRKQTTPINRSNLILFAKAPSKAINKLNRQKAN